MWGLVGLDGDFAFTLSEMEPQVSSNPSGISQTPSGYIGEQIGGAGAGRPGRRLMPWSRWHATVDRNMWGEKWSALLWAVRERQEAGPTPTFHLGAAGRQQ